MNYYLIIHSINVCLMTLLFPLALIRLISKAKAWKKTYQEYNKVQLYIIAIFLCSVWVIILDFLNFLTNFGILNQLSLDYQKTSISDINFYSMGSILATAFCISLIAYSNDAEEFIYFPFFLVAGFVLFDLIIGYDNWILFYIMIFGIIAIIFFYRTSWKFHDNGALCFGIYFTLISFPNIIFSDILIIELFSLTARLFIVLFAFDKIHLIRKEEKGEAYANE